MCLADNLVRIGPPRSGIHGLPPVKPENDQILFMGRCKFEDGFRELPARNLEVCWNEVLAGRVGDRFSDTIQAAFAFRIAGRTNVQDIQT